MSLANNYFAGLDIGGSTVKAALVDADGASTGALVEVKSRVKEGYKTTFEQLQEALRQLAEKANIEVSTIRGAGMDVPAPNCEGVVWTRANLGDDWVGTNVRDELSELLGIPVYMTNDGNAAALGEYAVRPDYSGGLLLVAPGTGLGEDLFCLVARSTLARMDWLLKSAISPFLIVRKMVNFLNAHVG